MKLSEVIRTLCLPEYITKVYNNTGVETLYTWQIRCLTIFFQGKYEYDKLKQNLVYSSPTGSGKTLIAEIITLCHFKHLFEGTCKASFKDNELANVNNIRKIAIFVFPYVTILIEKKKYLEKLFKKDIKVEVFHQKSFLSVTRTIETLTSSDWDTFPARFDIALCTIEKAHSLVFGLARMGVLCDYVTLLVVDELHLVDEAPDGRGALINSMISMSLFFSLNNRNFLQIVAMSATLPNLVHLGNWLNAQVFETNERTSTLTELLFCNSRLWELKHQHHKGCCKIPSDKYTEEIYKEGFCCSCCYFEPIHVSLSNLSQSDLSLFLNLFKKEEIYLLDLLIKNYKEKRSTILFGRSKRQVELYAECLTNGILNLINPYPSDAQKNLCDELLSCQAAYSTSKGSCQMAKFVILGIGYHHSGLSFQERNILQAAFCNSTINILCATSTIAVGVNLPVHYVIIKSPYIGDSFLTSTQYTQMAGRAGRSGSGMLGVSILCCNLKDVKACRNIMQGFVDIPRKTSNPIKNELSSSFLRYVLELIVCLSEQFKRARVYDIGTKHVGIPLTMIEKSALFFYNRSKSTIRSTDSNVDVSSALQYLVETNQIYFTTIRRTYLEVTMQGRAIALSGLDPKEGFSVYVEADQLSKQIVLDSELHLCYLCCPMSFSFNINWTALRYMIEKLEHSDRRSLENMGIDTSIIQYHAIEGRLSNQCAQYREATCSYKRLFVALLCTSLIRACPIQSITKMFNVTRGDIESLQSTIVSFGTMTKKLVQSLGWWPLETLLENFLPLLRLGTSTEYRNILQIPYMTLRLAKVLYRVGLQSVELIAATSVSKLYRCYQEHGILCGQKGNFGLLLATTTSQQARSYLKLKKGKEENLHKVKEERRKFQNMIKLDNLTLQDARSDFSKFSSLSLNYPFSNKVGFSTSQMFITPCNLEPSSTEHLVTGCASVIDGEDMSSVEDSNSETSEMNDFFTDITVSDTKNSDHHIFIPYFSNNLNFLKVTEGEITNTDSNETKETQRKFTEKPFFCPPIARDCYGYIKYKQKLNNKENSGKPLKNIFDNHEWRFSLPNVTHICDPLYQVDMRTLVNSDQGCLQSTFSFLEFMLQRHSVVILSILLSMNETSKKATPSVLVDTSMSIALLFPSGYLCVLPISKDSLLNPIVPECFAAFLKCSSNICVVADIKFTLKFFFSCNKLTVACLILDPFACHCLLTCQISEALTCESVDESIEELCKMYNAHSDWNGNDSFLDNELVNICRPACMYAIPSLNIQSLWLLLCLSSVLRYWILKFNLSMYMWGVERYYTEALACVELAGLPFDKTFFFDVSLEFLKTYKVPNLPLYYIISLRLMQIEIEITEQKENTTDIPELILSPYHDLNHDLLNTEEKKKNSTETLIDEYRILEKIIKLVNASCTHKLNVDEGQFEDIFNMDDVAVSEDSQLPDGNFKTLKKSNTTNRLFFWYNRMRTYFNSMVAPDYRFISSLQQGLRFTFPARFCLQEILEKRSLCSRIDNFFQPFSHVNSSGNKIQQSPFPSICWALVVFKDSLNFTCDAPECSLVKIHQIHLTTQNTWLIDVIHPMEPFDVTIKQLHKSEQSHINSMNGLLRTYSAKKIFLVDCHNTVSLLRSKKLKDISIAQKDVQVSVCRFFVSLDKQWFLIMCYKDFLIEILLALLSDYNLKEVLQKSAMKKDINKWLSSLETFDEKTLITTNKHVFEWILSFKDAAYALAQHAEKAKNKGFLMSKLHRRIYVTNETKFFQFYVMKILCHVTADEIMKLATCGIQKELSGIGDFKFLRLISISTGKFSFECLGKPLKDTCETFVKICCKSFKYILGHHINISLTVSKYLDFN
ncbi:uncharacterized protein LOC128884291 isoform X2 [Hylaeus volcanicus]|uniref:uncharacterized protein LOC128884291 isoform X2 n=1 Tax=Hylaeus volcanicus TaxID=313075 RepID=UPI0023B85838|nr:uncharacterized protein LOC128884291 isoform X2 [Hylaeus volcanicus]